MSVRSQLVEMGFAPNRIEAALKNTTGSLEESIAWIEEHQAQFDAAIKFDQGSSVPQSATDDTQHLSEDAAISGDRTIDGDGLQDSTSGTIVELTAEQKEAKLEALREKARIRKEEQAKKDSEERKKNEAILKKQTKEHRQIVEERQQKEAIKEAARRRQEAKDALIAKKRIKDLIESDKRARAEERARKDGSVVAPPAPAPALLSSSKTAPAPQQNITESKIRFRVQGKQVDPFMRSYRVETTLGEVATDISDDIGVAASLLVFMTTFPTQTLANDQFGSSLKELGLINTNLIVKV